MERNWEGGGGQQETYCPQAETKWFSLALIQILIVIKAQEAQEDRHLYRHTRTHLWSGVEKSIQVSVYRLFFFLA